MNQHWTVQSQSGNAELNIIDAIDNLIVGETPIMRHIKGQIALIGQSTASVLIQGDTGTGKELVAQALHTASGRQGKFIAMNCAAIPVELLESELFGYEKGSFTGADNRKIGRFEQAHGGTLFLDEIGDMPFALQAKLLRVLETRCISRLGSSTEIEVDFRLITATHRDIAALTEGEFRLDLFFRVAVFQLLLPSLSDRISDIWLIMQKLLSDIQKHEGNSNIPHFDAAAIRVLSAQKWKGNIRELRNMMIRASVLFPGQQITGAMVENFLLPEKLPSFPSEESVKSAPLPETQGLPNPSHFKINGQDLDMRVYIRDIEIALIESALEIKNGCVSKAANTLRLRRTTLIEKMKKYGVERNSVAPTP